VTSVAYSEQPQLPGWIVSALSLVIGWCVAGLALFVLYLAASFIGAISHPYPSPAGVINEWPYAENGAWSLIANVSVLVLALVFSTVATSWWLRRFHPSVSDGRLAITLLFTGSLPLVTPHRPAVAGGFVVALLLVRYWVGRHDGRLAPRAAAAVAAAPAAVVLSYGLLHPLWSTGLVPTASVGRYCSVLVTVHNAARAGVDIDRITTSDFTESPARPARLHLAPGADGTVTLRYLGGSGSGEFSMRAHYHVFGLALSEALPFHIQLRPDC
jgi:hypothetical protein